MNLSESVGATTHIFLVFIGTFVTTYTYKTACACVRVCLFVAPSRLHG